MRFVIYVSKILPAINDAESSIWETKYVTHEGSPTMDIDENQIALRNYANE